MSEPVSAQSSSEAASRPTSVLHTAGPVATTLGGAGLWVFSHMEWIVANIADDKAGDGVATVSGATWAVELTVLAVICVAVGIVSFFVRGLTRRVLGLVAVILGVASVLSPLQVLTGGVELTRVHELLVSQDKAPISQWAEITGATTSTSGPILTVVSILVAVVGGVLLLAVGRPADTPISAVGATAMDGGSDADESKQSRETDEQTFWDALDEDIDPTTASADDLPPERL